MSTPPRQDEFCHLPIPLRFGNRITRYWTLQRIPSGQRGRCEREAVRRCRQAEEAVERAAVFRPDQARQTAGVVQNGDGQPKEPPR